MGAPGSPDGDLQPVYICASATAGHANGYQAPAGTSSLSEEGQRRGWKAKLHTIMFAPTTTAQKALCWAFWICAVVVAGVLFAVIFPRFVEGVVQPFIALLRRKLTPAQIGAIIFAAMVVLPFTLVLSVVPFVWVSGIVFEFWLALLIVMAGVTVGMALQYLLARYVFHDRVVRFLERSPKRHGLAVTLRAVELAGAWKVVALLRLGPFPYSLLNYVLGVCPSIKFYVYIICSAVTELLPRALQVFFGRSLPTLADLFRGKVTNPGIAAYNVIVLLIGIACVVVSITYSKRTLRLLEAEELAKEQAEAGAAAGAAAAADPEAAVQGSAVHRRDDTATAMNPAAVAAKVGALPDEVREKVQTGSSAAAAAAAGVFESPMCQSSGSQADVEVLVDDASAGANSSSLARSASNNSWIAVGRESPAALATDSSISSSTSSRLASVASTQPFLSNKHASSSSPV